MGNPQKNVNTVLVFFALSFAAVAGLSFFARSLISFSIHVMEDNIRRRLVTVSELTAKLVTAEELDDYQTVDDMREPSYQMLRYKLRDFAKRCDVTYVYYMRLETRPHYGGEQPDVLRYIVDNDFNEKTRVGLDTEVYELFPYHGINEALDGRTFCSVLGEYDPGWDGLMTAYAPVFDTRGNVAAVAGADIYDKPIMNARKMLSVLSAAQIALLAMIFTAGLFFFLRFRREGKNRGKMETQSRIKQRFLIFSTVFFLVILAGTSAVFIPAMRRIINADLEHSLNLAVQSMRLRIANEVNTEISLSVKLADAPVIKRYFLNPADPLLRDEGLEEIAAYRQSFKANTVFWINDIDKIFYYDNGSHYQLNPDDLESYWYNMTLYETEKYNFNVNYNPEMKTISVFINAPVFDRGKPIGMVGTNIDLSVFIASMYRDLDTGMELYVFNSLGEITVARDQSLAFEKKSMGGHLGNLGKTILESAAALHSDTIKIFDTEDAKCAVSPLPFLGWYVAAFTPVKTAAIFDPVMTIIFLSMLGVVLVIFIIFYGFIGVIQARVDEQTRRLVELKDAAEAAAHSKSAFLANTSHEIRTPMNAILGMTELILRKEVSPDVYEEAQNIKQAGKNLLSIINDILDFSKIDSGRMDFNNDEYYFASLVNDVLSIIKMRIAEKRLCFTTRIDCALPSVLIGDEARVRQVLLNLLSNAVKYTPEGEISLCVRAVPCEGGGDGQKIRLVFEVTDTGVGIKHENMDRLFGEFVQFDSRKNQGIEGTGLGLAISRNLCRLMGGDISVESEYGKGSVFRALIPQQVKNAAPFAALRETGGKVLIAGHRRNQAEALVYTAERLGVSCSLAGTATEMLDLLRANQHRFVIASARFYEQAQKTLESLNQDVLLAFLPEFEGDSVPRGGRPLSLPVHPLVLARFFNGESESHDRTGGKSLAIKFTAPQVHLLLVDDIATNLKVAEGLLAPYRLRVDTCLSGAEAFRLIKERSYDIVFMDHMMPEMDGIEAAALIRSWEAEQGETYKRLCIIALTANAILGMREMFLEKGFNDYLTKPIEIAKLDELMAKWIPKEKREKGEAVPENGEADKEEAYFPAISGVDIQAGMLMTGGTPAGYRQVLSMFRKDAQTRLPLLREIPKKDDLPLFTTQVHALKSASASIGAAELSAQAARLEEAGKAGELGLIGGALPGFAALLETVVENIEAALNTASPDAKTTGDRVPPALLDGLEAALRSQRAGDIDHLLEELGAGAEGKIREALEQISDAVLMADFEQALESVTGLRSGV